MNANYENMEKIVLINFKNGTSTTFDIGLTKDVPISMSPIIITSDNLIVRNKNITKNNDEYFIDEHSEIIPLSEIKNYTIRTKTKKIDEKK